MSEKVRPSALLLVETSRGAGHMKVVSQLASSLKKRMFEVVVATGSMNVGSHFNYGNADIEELDRLSYDPRQPIVDINGEEQRFPDNESLRNYLKFLQLIGEAQIDADKFSLSFAKYPEEEKWQSEIRKTLTDRQKALRSLIMSLKPDVVISEFWPLGRSRSNVELVPLMKFVRQQLHDTLIISLERDIVFARPETVGSRVEYTNELIDAVIVRGDSSVTAIEETMPGTSGITRPIFYAGFFGSKPPSRSGLPDNQREVVVSAGGGFRPDDLIFYDSTIKACAETDFNNRKWQIFVPPNCPEEIFGYIKRKAQDTVLKDDGEVNVTTNCQHDKFRQQVAESQLLVSQGGYNATLEAAVTETPTIVIPALDEDDASLYNQQEQVFRANRLAEMGLVHVVTPQDAANAEYFSKVINEVGNSSKRQSQFKLEGSEIAADYIHTLVNTSKRYEEMPSRRRDDDLSHGEKHFHSTPSTNEAEEENTQKTTVVNKDSA